MPYIKTARQGCAGDKSRRTRRVGLDASVAAAGKAERSTSKPGNCWIGSEPSRALRKAAPAPESACTKYVTEADYPHNEGSTPFSRESMRRAFAGVDPAELHQIFAVNAAELYGFDLEKLAPLAAQYGPTVAEIRALRRRPDRRFKPLLLPTLMSRVRGASTRR